MFCSPDEVSHTYENLKINSRNWTDIVARGRRRFFLYLLLLFLTFCVEYIRSMTADMRPEPSSIKYTAHRLRTALFRLYTSEAESLALGSCELYAGWLRTHIDRHAYDAIAIFSFLMFPHFMSGFANV